MLYFVKNAIQVFIQFCNLNIPMGFGYQVRVVDVIIFMLVFILIAKIIFAMAE